MSSFIFTLVKSFAEIAKDLRPDYIESWLNGKINDYDMDMTLLTESQSRSYTYKKLNDIIGES